MEMVRVSAAVLALTVRKMKGSADRGIKGTGGRHLRRDGTGEQHLQRERVSAADSGRAPPYPW